MQNTKIEHGISGIQDFDLIPSNMYISDSLFHYDDTAVWTCTRLDKKKNSGLGTFRTNTMAQNITSRCNFESINVGFFQSMGQRVKPKSIDLPDGQPASDPFKMGMEHAQPSQPSHRHKKKFGLLVKMHPPPKKKWST